MKGWLAKWGPSWFGPATMLLLLTITARWHAYAWTRQEHDAYAEMNRMRMDAIEKRLELMDKWTDEHKQVTASRIAQLDALDRDGAVEREAISAIKADIQEIKMDVRSLRDHAGLRPRSGAGSP